MTLSAVLAMRVRIAAQEQEQQRAERPPHCVVADLGTLGGTYSLVLSRPCMGGDGPGSHGLEGELGGRAGGVIVCDLADRTPEQKRSTRYGNLQSSTQ